MKNQDQQKYVWYIAYGSNLSRQRFLVYILGGRARGGKQKQPGCTDRTLPQKDIAIEIKNSLYFSGHSFIYNGAVAFINQVPDDSHTKVRAYLIAEEQFWQVTTQENNWTNSPKFPDIQNICALGFGTLPDMGGKFSQYTRIVYCGERDGYPLLSFTTATPHEKPLKPSALYLETMGQGLVESHRLTPEEMTAYFLTLPGVAGEYTLNELVKICHNAAKRVVGNHKA